MTFPFNPNDFIIINYCHYRSKIPGKVESQSYRSSQLPGIFGLLHPGRKKKKDLVSTAITVEKQSSLIQKN